MIFTNFPESLKVKPEYLWEFFPLAKDINGENVIVELYSPRTEEDGIIRGIDSNTLGGYLENSFKFDENDDEIFIGGNNSNYSQNAIELGNDYVTHPIPWLIWDVTTNPSQPRLYGWPHEIDHHRNYDVVLKVTDNSTSRIKRLVLLSVTFKTTS